MHWFIWALGVCVSIVPSLVGFEEDKHRSSLFQQICYSEDGLEIGLCKPNELACTGGRIIGDCEVNRVCCVKGRSQAQTGNDGKSIKWNWGSLENEDALFTPAPAHRHRRARPPKPPKPDYDATGFHFGRYLRQCKKVTTKGREVVGGCVESYEFCMERGGYYAGESIIDKDPFFCRCCFEIIFGTERVGSLPVSFYREDLCQITDPTGKVATGGCLVSSYFCTLIQGIHVGYNGTTECYCCSSLDEVPPGFSGVVHHAGTQTLDMFGTRYEIGSKVHEACVDYLTGAVGICRIREEECYAHAGAVESYHDECFCCIDLDYAWLRGFSRPTKPLALPKPTTNLDLTELDPTGPFWCGKKFGSSQVEGQCVRNERHCLFIGGYFLGTNEHVTTTVENCFCCSATGPGLNVDEEGEQTTRIWSEIYKASSLCRVGEVYGVCLISKLECTHKHGSYYKGTFVKSKTGITDCGCCLDSPINPTTHEPPKEPEFSKTTLKPGTPAPTTVEGKCLRSIHKPRTCQDPDLGPGAGFGLGGSKLGKYVELSIENPEAEAIVEKIRQCLTVTRMKKDSNGNKLKDTIRFIFKLGSDCLTFKFRALRFQLFDMKEGTSKSNFEALTGSVTKCAPGWYPNSFGTISDEIDLFRNGPIEIEFDGSECKGSCDKRKDIKLGFELMMDNRDATYNGNCDFAIMWTCSLKTNCEFYIATQGEVKA